MSEDYMNDVPLTNLGWAFGETLSELSHRWITRLSEFLGARAGLNCLTQQPPFAMQMEGILGRLDKKPPLESREAWEEYKAFWLENNASAVNVVYFASRDPSVIAPFPVSTPLPSRHTLNSPFPVRDQGTDGTCVACAVASAIEYYTGREINAELTRKLYDASRNIDGVRGVGTGLRDALTIVRESNLWSGERVLTPGAIDLWKATLYGVDGVKESPIIASFATYSSWLYSKAGRLSGKWTLPFHDEPCVGLHAVLVVGYQDDPSVPGGGYFIVRNSWGEGYGDRGYARVPYEYVQRYCADAFAAASEKKQEQEYVRVLERDARDVYGELLKKGARVVAHPREPDVFCADSASARREFIENGYAWTAERRVRNYLPALSDEARSRVDARTKAAKRFVNGVRTNLDALVGTESPFPSPSRFMSRGPRKFTVVEEIADLSKAVQTRLAYRNKLHSKIVLWKNSSNDWLNALDATAVVKIWRVGDDRNAFAVVGIWLAPIRFSPTTLPTFEAPTSATLKIALEVVDEWKRNSKETFEAICETFGAFDGSWQGMEGVASGLPYAFSTFDPNERGGCWHTTTSESVDDERTRALVPYLRPTTLGETAAYIQSVLERQSLVFFGDFTVEYVAKKADVRKDEAEAALNELVKNGKYEIYQTARDENAYRKRG